MTQEQQQGIALYHQLSRTIWGIMGDSQRYNRQSIMQLVTGKKHPIAKCGVNAVRAAVESAEQEASQ